MKAKPVILFLIVSALALDGAKCEENLISKLKPDRIKIQFAGNIGFFSAGCGYNLFSGKMQSDIFYGYVPPLINNNNIHILSNKFTFNVSRHSLSTKWNIINSAGVTFSYSATNGNFIFLPDYYPKNYYKPNAFTSAPNFTLHLIHSNDHKWKTEYTEFYFEISTLNKYLYYMIKTGAINPVSILNLGIGIAVPVGKSRSF